MYPTIYRSVLLVLTAILMTGCVATAPKQPFNQNAFSSGTVVLTCSSIGCASTWGANITRMRSLYDSRQWDALAQNIISINFANDLTYYYLGRAAEGKGYFSAAANYYRASSAAMKCAGIFNVCNGLDVPNLAAARLKIVESSRSASRPSQPTGMSTADAQARLKTLGWYTGVVDGMYGPRTADAIKKYQYSSGLPQTGIIDSATAVALSDVRPAQSSTSRRVDKGADTPVTIPSDGDENRSPPPEAKSESAAKVGQATTLKVRAELLDDPDPFAGVVTTLPRGARVMLLDVVGEWALIEHDGKKGYVYKDQLR